MPTTTQPTQLTKPTQLLLALRDTDETNEGFGPDRVVLCVDVAFADELLQLIEAHRAAADITEVPLTIVAESEDLNSLVKLVAFYEEEGDGDSTDEKATLSENYQVNYITGDFRLDDEADRAEVLNVSFLIDESGVNVALETPDGDVISEPIDEDVLDAISQGTFD